jgi:hypothetical protein
MHLANKEIEQKDFTNFLFFFISLFLEMGKMKRKQGDFLQ